MCGAYLPGYKAGGPIRSIENLVARLGRELHFKILTADRDLRELSIPGCRRKWMGSRRRREGDVSRARIAGNASHVCTALCCRPWHGPLSQQFFSPRFSILAMLLCWLKVCRPRAVVMAPRGEFSPGALGLKRKKKLRYIKLSRWLGVHRNVIWQASSDREAKDIARQFRNARQINIAGNLPKAIETGKPGNGSEAGAKPEGQDHGTPGLKKVPGRLRALFVSRLSRMKNLSGALHALRRV